jgi:hypothetical protein
MLMMTWMLSAFDPSDQQNHLPHFWAAAADPCITFHVYIKYYVISIQLKLYKAWKAWSRIFIFSKRGNTVHWLFVVCWIYSIIIKCRKQANRKLEKHDYRLSIVHCGFGGGRPQMLIPFSFSDDDNEHGRTSCRAVSVELLSNKSIFKMMTKGWRRK